MVNVTGKNNHRRIAHITGQRPVVHEREAGIDIDQELAAHLEQTVEDMVNEGWSPEAARAEARRRFGDPDAVRDECRVIETHRDRWLRLGQIVQAIRQDLRLSLRTHRRRPFFALMVIAILSLGIGSVTVIFSVFDTLLLRPLPCPDSHRLVYITANVVSPGYYADWREHLSTLDALAATWNQRLALIVGDRPEWVNAARITPHFFELMGGTTSLGRLPTPEEYEAGEDYDSPEVVLLSHRYWQNRWGSDPGVIGQQVQVGGASVTVIGILAPDFRPPRVLINQRTDVWAPMTVGAPGTQSYGFAVLSVTGRLAEGTGINGARQEMTRLVHSMADVLPDRYLQRDGTPLHLYLMSLHEAEVRGIAPRILLLLISVGFLLLIACANVANLFLARGTDRAHEVALRGALGASRRRIILWIMTESTALALAGGMLGFGLAHFGLRLFIGLEGDSIPGLASVHLDLRILAGALAIATLTGILCGLLPALIAAHRKPHEILKESGTGVTWSRRSGSIGRRLVIAEIALTLALLVGAGTMLRSLAVLVSFDLPLATERLMTIPLRLGPAYSGEERILFMTDILDRVRRLPGTEAVAAIPIAPFEHTGPGQSGWHVPFTSTEAPADAEPLTAIMHPISPGYFTTLEHPLLTGREFTSADIRSQPTVAIINYRTAMQLFGETDVLGRTLRVADTHIFTIVGVVEGIPHWGLRQGMPYGLYIPHSPLTGFMDSLQLVVRTSAETEIFAPAVRSAVWSLDPGLPVDDIIPMQDRVDESLATPRSFTWLFAGFGAMALILALAGMYSTMLYMVGRQRREFGVRYALGADGGRVIRQVFSYGLRQVGIGIGIGTAGAIVLTLALQVAVWGVGTLDPLVVIGAGLIICLTAILVTLYPAWRAVRTDPVEILRVE